MSHPVEDFLSFEGTIEDLKNAPYFLNVREESNENGKKVWVIDYDQIESPRFNHLVDHCRGIVVCQETLKVVCPTFKRFYNVGEDARTENEFDWDNSFCLSKEDGSFIKVYYFDGKWRVGTRGTAFAQNTLFSYTGEETTITYEELFLRTLKMNMDEFQDECWKRLVIPGEVMFFELCAKENRVVTPYEKDTVFILGGFTLAGREVSNVELFEFRNAKYPTFFSMDSFDDVLKCARELKDLKEGFVLCDSSNRRLKVKSPVYVIAHHTRGTVMTGKRAVDLILMNEHHEFLAVFDEYTEFFMKFIDRMIWLKNDCIRDFEDCCGLESQKDFAMAVKDKPYSGLLFSMRKGISFDNAWDALTTNSKYRLLGASD